MPGATRTPDLQLRRLTLYPTELQAHTVNGYISLTNTDISCQGFCVNAIRKDFDSKCVKQEIITKLPFIGKVS